MYKFISAQARSNKCKKKNMMNLISNEYFQQYLNDISVFAAT